MFANKIETNTELAHYLDILSKKIPSSPTIVEDFSVFSSYLRCFFGRYVLWDFMCICAYCQASNNSSAYTISWIKIFLIISKSGALVQIVVHSVKFGVRRALHFNVGSLSASIGLSRKEIEMDRGKGCYKGNRKG